MRLGEIKKIIGNVLDENKNIVIKSEPIFGGQAYTIQNYSNLISALDILEKQSWNKEDFIFVENIRTIHGTDSENIIVPQEEFNKISEYVTKINQILPIYYSILETMTEKQDEKIINVKLPNKLVTLSALSFFNERLSKMFKSFQVDGEFEFRQFDTGSCWYEVCATGVYTYTYFIACLKIAQEYLKVELEYFKSREAKISYEAAKSSPGQGVEVSFSDYQKSWLREFISEEIRQLVEEKIKKTNGETGESLHSKLVIAVTSLVNELGEGTEFHLSLNPPEYAIEQAGQLKIDYQKIKDIKGLGPKPIPEIQETKIMKEESLGK